MNILLLSMPDSFEHMPEIVVRMPNGALTSLAGNLDPHHRVAVADLILVQRRVPETVDRLVREIQPDVIGLSIMTFQRRTALRIIDRIRAERPQVRVVVGGYDPSLRRTRIPGTPESTLLCGAKEISPFANCCALRGSAVWLRTGRGPFLSRWRLLDSQSGTHRKHARRRERSVAPARRQCTSRLWDAWPPGGYYRDIARLHLRLQFLLDY